MFLILYKNLNLQVVILPSNSDDDDDDEPAELDDMADTGLDEWILPEGPGNGPLHEAQPAHKTIYSE